MIMKEGMLMITVVQTTIPDQVIRHIESNRGLLTRDVSNYAKGRMRAWIGLEAPLTDSQSFKAAPFKYGGTLWQWLHPYCIEHLDFEPEIALLHVGGADCSDPEKDPDDGRGGECGIQTHRDAGYADFRAVGINLIGEATFGYRDCYGTQDRWVKEQNDSAPTQLVHMRRGTAVVFNCKNPHFASVGPNRWCINAWRISRKRRDEYREARLSIR